MRKHYLFILLSIVMLGGGLIFSRFFMQPTQEMPYTQFIENVETQNIYKVVLEDNKKNFSVALKNQEDLTYLVMHPKTDDFTEYLLLNNVPIQYGQVSTISNVFQILLVMVIAFSIFYYVRYGKSNALIVDGQKNTKNRLITFNDIAGNTEAKAMVQDIIHFIQQPEKYATVGAKMPRGILLYGPPGTGKTLMAKAIAGEANVPYYAMSGSDFVQMYVGVGASRVRSLFTKAKKSEKAVIFIDEIDAIGKKRGRTVSASNDERDQTLNALLTEMSGFNDNAGIVVIAATNRLDMLDDALLRPGRFDRQIEIGLPDVNARYKILSLYGNKKPLSDEIDLYELSKSTVSFSGAMLEHLLNEAAISAANRNHDVIASDDIDKAFYTVIAGAQKEDRSYLTENDRKITAYHEAGHALLTHLRLPEHYIAKVTIIPSVRGAGGFNLNIPKDRMYQTKAGLRASIQMLLAGRIAEELVFGSDNITTGASNDIIKASSLMVDYINKFGMDPEYGLFNIDAIEGSLDQQLAKNCREQLRILYDETKDYIEDNLDLLIKIAEALLEKESISGDDIQLICA